MYIYWADLRLAAFHVIVPSTVTQFHRQKDIYVYICMYIICVCVYLFTSMDVHKCI